MKSLWSDGGHFNVSPYLEYIACKIQSSLVSSSPPTQINQEAEGGGVSRLSEIPQISHILDNKTPSLLTWAKNTSLNPLKNPLKFAESPLNSAWKPLKYMGWIRPYWQCPLILHAPCLSCITIFSAPCPHPLPHPSNQGYPGRVQRVFSGTHSDFPHLRQLYIKSPNLGQNSRSESPQEPPQICREPSQFNLKPT